MKFSTKTRCRIRTLLEIALHPKSSGVFQKDIAENQMTDSQDMPFTITDVSIDNVTAKAFEIYPNPVQNVLYFKNFNKIEKIEIYNTIGKVIFTNNGNRSHIDISNFEKGIYFIKINTKEKNIFIEKIIKN